MHPPRQSGSYGQVPDSEYVGRHMKNQYFGDINDYVKYGVLRGMAEEGVRICVCWMLTEDDKRADGGKIQYLKKDEEWRKYDPELFDVMRESVEGGKRSIAMAEERGIVPSAVYHSAPLSDDLAARERYFAELSRAAKDCDLIFFDADNGMEVKSVRKGGKRSCKYLFWDEVRSLSSGHSLLVFQYFPRVAREEYTGRQAEEFLRCTGARWVKVLESAHVGYFLAAHTGHEERLTRAVEKVTMRWAGVVMKSVQVSGFSVQLRGDWDVVEL